MVLPIGFERRNEKLYEEVNIPVNDRPPEDFHFMPVYINTLDEVSSVCYLYSSSSCWLIYWIFCQFQSYILVDTVAECRKLGM